MTLSTDNITVGSEKTLYNTAGNTTEIIKPNFDPSEPIKDHDTNSSEE